MRFFRKRPAITANPVDFVGEGVYEVALPDLGYGLVFEDDGATGYLYVTSLDFSEIYDAVHVYDRGDKKHELQLGEEAFIVWSSDLKKAGLFYRNLFQAGVDFLKKEARSRTGFPPTAKDPWSSDRSWRDDVVAGLEP